MDCVRRAWLDLDGLLVELHDESAGYFCTELDLGTPDVRAVTSNRPDADGLDDRTQFLGGRVVSANIVALAGAGAVIDDVADSFAPFMVPNRRPLLHYILDRPGTPERVLTVRAQAYSFKVDDAYQRDIQLQFLAADPIARDPAGQSEIAWAGASGGIQGRRYDLTYDRVYPPGSSSPAQATLYSPGDVAVAPLLRIYGPVTGAEVDFTAGGAQAGAVAFVASYVIAAGHYVDVDCDAMTAYLDGNPQQSVLTSLAWATISAHGGWPLIPPRTTTYMSMLGSSTTAATQTVATWNDGYLS